MILGFSPFCQLFWTYCFQKCSFQEDKRHQTPWALLLNRIVESDETQLNLLASRTLLKYYNLTKSVRETF